MSIDNFAKLQELIMSDRRLVSELSGIRSIKEFADRLIEIARGVDLTITQYDVHRAAADAHRTDHKTFPVPIASSDCVEWMPARVIHSDSRLTVEWCHFGNGRLTEPFFEDSTQKHLRRPFNRIFRPTTDIATLRALPTDITPTGFIFHMSRCGSTLVSQMLAAIDSNIVIAEAPPIDDILSLRSKPNAESNDQRIELLRFVINALGRKRFPQETRLFIKFDSWAILDLEVIQNAFPDTPWIFIFRNPVEVMVSHMRQPGMQMVPGLVRAFDDLNDYDFENSSREEYCAHVLDRICMCALRHAQTGNGMFVDYEELPFGFERIADHFGAQFTSEEIETMLRVTEFNAKTPQLFFSPDSQEKRREATPQVQCAAARLIPLYDQLRSLSARRGKHNDQVA